MSSEVLRVSGRLVQFRRNTITAELEKRRRPEEGAGKIAADLLAVYFEMVKRDLPRFPLRDAYALLIALGDWEPTAEGLAHLHAQFEDRFDHSRVPTEFGMVLSGEIVRLLREMTYGQKAAILDAVRRAVKLVEEGAVMEQALAHVGLVAYEASAASASGR